MAFGTVVAAGAILVIVRTPSGAERSTSTYVSHYKPPREETSGQAMLVIGDSWTLGGTMNDGPTWPWLMDLPAGWTVLTDAIGGTGYIGDHADSALTHGGRLAHLLRDYDPDVVLVAMGRNDVQHDPDAVVKVARHDLTMMKRTWPGAQIVVFSPFSPEVPPASYTVALTARLRQLAGSLDLPFLDASHLIDDRARLIEDDHPNDAGQAAVARGVQQRLTALGVLD